MVCLAGSARDSRVVDARKDCGRLLSFAFFVGVDEAGNMLQVLLRHQQIAVALCDMPASKLAFYR
jgi:hypothetical protein